jgi:hypothetical protein
MRRAIVVIIAGCCLVFGVGFAAGPQGPGAGKKQGKTMTAHAKGSFEVDIAPLTLNEKAADSGLGRMSLNKKFLGDLEATSKGEMLTAMTAVKGSAGYVAVERVDGKLNGRAGTFALQHSGTMTRGEPTLSIAVVPDSGTGDLEGLAGKLTIKIEDKKHFYEFEYTLPEKP